MSEYNLKIWKAGSKSDSGAIGTKKDQNNNSSINSYYVFEAATRIFGPVGVGWGYVIDQERLDDGKPVLWNDQVIWEKTHTLFGHIWYMHEGSRSETVPHFGHTKQLYWSHKGSYWVNDDEAPKKSLTDMIKKCLSMTGIYADVFKGMLENQTYMMERHIEESLSNADSRAQKEEEFINQMRLEIETRKQIFIDCKSHVQVEKAASLGLEKVSAFRNTPTLSKHAEKAAAAINAAAQKRYDEITKEMENKK